MTRSELFWGGRVGMLLILAAVWVVAGGALAVLLLDRAQAEPWVRAVMPTLLSMLATRPTWRPHFAYSPLDYLGLEAALVVTLGIATATIGAMLARKRSRDRRIDAYLASRWRGSWGRDRPHRLTSRCAARI